MNRRTRTCWHEAGHLLIAHLVGDHLDGATVRPGTHYAGVTGHTATITPTADDIDQLGGRLHDQPPRLRRWIETRGCIALAGDLAAEVGAMLPPLTEPDTVPDTAPAAVAVPRPLTRRWAEHDTSDAFTADDKFAWEQAWLLTPDIHTQRALIDLWTAVTRSMLRAAPAELTRVAQALSDHGELSGSAATRLIEGHHDADHEAQAS